jgi:hypothetical protein
MGDFGVPESLRQFRQQQEQNVPPITPISTGTLGMIEEGDIKPGEEIRVAVQGERRGEYLGALRTRPQTAQLRPSSPLQRSVFFPAGTEEDPINIPPEDIDIQIREIERFNQEQFREDRQNNDLSIIKKYGGIATGLIALGGLGMMVLNKQTADATEDLYEEEVLPIVPLPNEKEEENMSEDEKKEMNKFAKMIQVVYDRRKAGGTNFVDINPAFRQRDVNIPNQDVEGYKFERTGNDLTGVFINDEKGEIVIAMRGLMPLNDKKDLLQFPEMTASSALEEQRGDAFGKTFRADRKMLEKVYLDAKKLYPDYNIITTGHSRGGRGAIYLGRKYDLEFHAFSPATNRGDLADTNPTEKGNHYYHFRDPVSRHMASKRGGSIEQHYVSYNNRLYPHSLVDFQKDGKYHDATMFLKQPRMTRADIDEMERLIVDEVIAENTKIDNFISGEDFIDSDLGRFPDDPIPEKNNAPILETGYGKTTNRGIFVNVNKRMVSKFKPQISLFDTIDKNNDNEISKEELKAFYPDLTDEEIDRLFRLYDKDKSGTLNRSEFTLTSLG